MGKGSEQTLLCSKEDIQGAQRHVKGWHHLPSERCKLKPQWGTTSHWSEWPSANQQTTSAREVVEKGTPSALLVGMQTGAATVENSMELPEKTKNGTAF